MKAYVDTSMGAHDVTSNDVDRAVYYEASDIEELCENEDTEPGTLRSYEGVRIANENVVNPHGTDPDGNIDIYRSKEDRRKALLRLIDVANASAELLQTKDEDYGEEEPTDMTITRQEEAKDVDTPLNVNENNDLEPEIVSDAEVEGPPALETNTRPTASRQCRRDQ